MFRRLKPALAAPSGLTRCTRAVTDRFAFLLIHVTGVGRDVCRSVVVTHDRREVDLAVGAGDLAGVLRFEGYARRF